MYIYEGELKILIKKIKKFIVKSQYKISEEIISGNFGASSIPLAVN